MGYRYDANGNLLSLHPPGKPLHEFTYTAGDLNDGYLPPTDPTIVNRTTSYAFNFDGQLTDVTRPDGGLVNLAYEAGNTGRLSSLTQPRGTTQFTYWDVHQPNTVDASGQLKTAAGPDGVTCAYEYDGPLLKQESWSGAVAGSVSRSYDNAFRDSLETVTAGATSSAVKFAYDADGLLTEVAPLSGTTWAYKLFRGGPLGLPDSTQVGAEAGRVTSSVAYNGYGEMAEMNYARGASPLFHQSIVEWPERRRPAVKHCRTRRRKPGIGLPGRAAGERDVELWRWHHGRRGVRSGGEPVGARAERERYLF